MKPNACRAFLSSSNYALWLIAVVASAAAADADFYFVVKGQRFTQLDPDPPTVTSGNPYRFNAAVGETAPNSVTSATVQALPLAVDPTVSNQLGYEAKFASLNALDAAFPSGDYAVVLQTVHDGNKNITLHLAGDAYPASAPHISNFAALQAVDPAQSFSVAWDPFPGGTVNDFVQLEIADTNTSLRLFRSPDPGQPNSLDGTATSVSIPAGTLVAGKTYFAQVVFSRSTGVDLASYAGVPGLVGYYKATQFILATTSGTTSPDVSLYLVAKEEDYAQTGAAAPQPLVGTPYTFLSFVNMSGPGTVLNATVEALPGGPLNNLSSDAESLNFEQQFATAGARDAAFPNGSYRLTMQTVHDGTRAITLNLTGDTYPSVPHVSNYAAAQAIDSAAGFTLTWDPIAGGTVDDFMQVMVEGGDTIVFRTANPGAADALSGASTAVVIPANTLAPGKTYLANVLVARGVGDLTSYPGALGFAGYVRATEMSLHTIAPTSTDIAAYSIHKQQNLFQNSTGAPFLAGASPWRFTVAVLAQAAGTINSAQIGLPTGSAKAIPLAAPAFFTFQNGFSTEGNLDNAYPAGTYTFTINAAHDGTKVLPLDLPGHAYPSPPHINNFPAAQAVDAAADFTVSWDPFPGATGTDAIGVTVTDSTGAMLFPTAVAPAAGTLASTATSIVIPANILPPGQTNQVRVVFVKRTTFDTTSLLNATGAVSFRCQTLFNLITTAPAPPRLVILAPTPDGRFQLQVRGEANRTYGLEATSDLSPVSWTQLTKQPAVNGSFNWVDDQSTNLLRRFYRAALAP